MQTQHIHEGKYHKVSVSHTQQEIARHICDTVLGNLSTDNESADLSKRLEMVFARMFRFQITYAHMLKDKWEPNSPPFVLVQLRNVKDNDGSYHFELELSDSISLRNRTNVTINNAKARDIDTEWNNYVQERAKKNYDAACKRLNEPGAPNGVLRNQFLTADPFFENEWEINGGKYVPVCVNPDDAYSQYLCRIAKQVMLASTPDTIKQVPQIDKGQYATINTNCGSGYLWCRENQLHVDSYGSTSWLTTFTYSPADPDLTDPDAVATVNKIEDGILILDAQFHQSNNGEE